MRKQLLRVEAMTEASFAPFGCLIDAPEHPDDRRPLFPIPFECDGQPTLNAIWQPSKTTVFNQLERHFGVTQTFFQLSGSPSVVCVAPATDLDDPQAVPRPGDVRAFMIDPSKGWSFARGTWHSLDRYVLTPPGATFVILNVDPNPSQIVDYSSGESQLFDDLATDTPTSSGPLPGDFGLQFELTL